MTRPVLNVENLRVEIAGSGLDIVDEITFSVSAGEVLGLVGESGSGKTTVGLALLGHCRRGAKIAGGSVQLDGAEILRLPWAELRRLRGALVSYVPQDPPAALNPALRVGRQLEETLAAHGFEPSSREGRAQIAEVLDEVMLGDDPRLLRRYPHQLSGGQQQRIVLAMAFVCRPRVIVLDEPTTGLDVTTQAHVLHTVRELCSAHDIAAVYITHDLTVIAELAHQVAVMYAGRLVEYASKHQLFGAGGAHPYTRRLIEAIPDVKGRFWPIGIAGAAPSPGRRPPGCFFSSRCDLCVDQCLTEFPPSQETDVGSYVRCWRFRDVSAESLGVRTRRATRMEREHERQQSLLSIRNVTASYSGVEVLHSINLDVWPGECLALVGESGSGKTTLAQSIAGIHNEWKGEILFNGISLSRRARSRTSAMRRAIQYVFQNPYSSLNPRKTVGESVAQTLSLFFDPPKQELEERVRQMLERVALDVAYADRFPDQLSGGERQRVAIARAIAAEPSILVCDEPTSALDVSVQATIVELLRSLQKGMSFGLVFITHNLGLARTLAQDVAVMSAGRIVEVGKSDRIFAAPTSEYTRRLIADTPSLDRATESEFGGSSADQIGFFGRSVC